ncbi:hypothetical protein PFISCL1PPCAC_3734, partial [Pristionchus fissidentatus]
RSMRRMPKYSDSVLHYHLRPELVRLQLQIGISSTLDRRHGRSCDLNAAIREENEGGRGEFGSRMNNNPIAQITNLLLTSNMDNHLFVPGQDSELARRRTMPKRKSIVTRLPTP